MIHTCIRWNNNISNSDLRDLIFDRILDFSLFDCFALGILISGFFYLYVYCSCGTFFISREDSTAERRYRKERWSENYMHMAAFSTRTCLLLPLSSFPPLSPPCPPPSLITPSKCDNRGSRPAQHFRAPHTPSPP